jgi:purine-binding chemotaxis protein CheW
MELTETVRQYLTFVVSKEEYAIDVLRVREVVGIVPITRVPSAPRHVRGVVNLRGSVVPVVDLGLRFGEVPLTPTRRARVVVVELGRGPEEAVGLLVDSVNRVVTLGPSDLVSVPAFGTRANAGLLSGMAVVDSAFVQIVVPERVAQIQGTSDVAPVDQFQALAGPS